VSRERDAPGETRCRVLDALEAKVVKKDLINCQLG
jgi:hypothetical protein